MSNITLGLVIGASLASSFYNSVGSATKSVSQLQKKSEGLQLKAKAGRRYLDLQNEIENTGVKLEATGYKSVELGRKLIQLEKSSYAAGLEAKNLGFDLGSIGREMKKVSTESQRAEKAISRMQAVAARKVELSSLRMRLMGFAGIGYLVARSFSTAVKTEQARFRLSTVINTDEKNKAEAMKKARQTAAEAAQSGLTGFNDAFGIQYALNSAGLTAQLSRAAAPVVAGVAKLTGGMREQVGEVLATNYNNLGSRLKGSEAEKFARIGDLLTKVQYKYQIRDFGQLGEGMKYAASAVNQYNVNLEQSYAAIGELNSAGLQGGMAGTGFSAMMRQIQIGASKGLVSIKRTKEGQVDLVKTLELVKKKTDRMSADEKASFIQKLAGDEGARALVPLMKNLESFRKNVNDVAATSKGIVGKGISDWSKTSEAGLMKLNGAIEVASFSLKEGFLPVIGEVAAGIAPVVIAFGTWVQQNPDTVKMIGSVIAGFGGMKAAMIVGRMAILGIANAFSVVMSHPIVFGLATIGLVAFQIWKNWDFLKGKLLQFWDGIKTKWASIGETLKGFFSPFFTWIDEKVGWIIGKWAAFKNLLSIGPDVGNISTGRGSNKAAPKTPRHGHTIGSVFDKPHIAAISEGGKKGAVMPLAGNKGEPIALPGHAAGGIFGKPHIAAISEGGKKEAVIPLEGNKERARSIHAYVGMMLGRDKEEGPRPRPAASTIGKTVIVQKNGRADAPVANNTINKSRGENSNNARAAQSISMGPFYFNITPPAGSDAADVEREVRKILADLERRARAKERGKFIDAPVFG